MSERIDEIKAKFEAGGAFGRMTIEQWFDGSNDYETSIYDYDYDINQRWIYLRGTREEMVSMLSGASIHFSRCLYVESAETVGNYRVFKAYDTMFRGEQANISLTLEQCKEAQRFLSQ